MDVYSPEGQQTQCLPQDSSSSTAAFTFSNLAAGATDTDPGYFIINDYYGPNDPSGNPNEISDLSVNVSTAFAGTSLTSTRITVPAGSGFTVEPSGWVGIPLDPSHSTN